MKGDDGKNEDGKGYDGGKGGKGGKAGDYSGKDKDGQGGKGGKGGKAGDYGGKDKDGQGGKGGKGGKAGDYGGKDKDGKGGKGGKGGKAGDCGGKGKDSGKEQGDGAKGGIASSWESSEPKASGVNVSVKVLFMSGEVAWGPEEVDDATTVQQLKTRVADKLTKPACAIHLLSGGSDELSHLSMLSSLGAGPEISLQCSVDGQIVEAQETFEKFQAVFYELNPSDPVEQVECVPLAHIEANIQEIAGQAGLKELPAEVAAWLHVLLSSNKSFCDFTDDFEFDPAGFLEGMPESSGAAPGGLLYLSNFGDNDNMLYHIIDAGGELAKMNGEEGCGAIYFAETWDDIWDLNENGVPSILSADFWKHVNENGREQFDGCTVCTFPKRVADSLTAFFSAWIANRGAPGGRRGV